MNLTQYIAPAIALGVSLGTVIGIAIVYSKKTVTTSSGEVISLLQKEVEVYRDQLHKKEEFHAKEMKEMRDEFTKQVTSLTKDFGVLQGQYNSMKDDKEKFEAIAKDKNPEMQTFMTSMAETQKEIITILGDIHTMAKAEHERDFQINATITKTS
jgi:hypothetical protein